MQNTHTHTVGEIAEVIDGRSVGIPGEPSGASQGDGDDVPAPTATPSESCRSHPVIHGIGKADWI